MGSLCRAEAVFRGISHTRRTARGRIRFVRAIHSPLLPLQKVFPIPGWKRIADFRRFIGRQLVRRRAGTVPRVVSCPAACPTWPFRTGRGVAASPANPRAMPSHASSQRTRRVEVDRGSSRNRWRHPQTATPDPQQFRPGISGHSVIQGQHSATAKLTLGVVLSRKGHNRRGRRSAVVKCARPW